MKHTSRVRTLSLLPLIVGLSASLFDNNALAATAPAITTQPQNQTVNPGANASFTVAATGTTPRYYQWRFNGNAISGATKTSYSRTNCQSGDAGSYSVVVTNVAGTATSSNAILTVNVPPSITTQPESQTVNPGSTATFTVAAAGTTPFSYQWRYNAANISGATASSYSISNVQSGDAGSYSVIVTNVAGSSTSSVATLSVRIPPSITTQPVGGNAAVGANVTFSVSATGTAPLSYQWSFNGNNISGATSGSYIRWNAQVADSGAYAVTVTNLAGATSSSPAQLTVMLPPAIFQQPGNASVYYDGYAVFTVVPRGTAPLNYQWKYNGTAISGATNRALILANVSDEDTGTYSVVVTNAVGTATSAGATLSLVPPSGTMPELPTNNPPPRLTLDLYRFDETNCLSWKGDLPMNASNLSILPSWSSNALRLDSSNPGLLQYRDTETNGTSRNITCDTGSLRFWINPSFSSTNQSGTGLGADAPLIELGTFTTNASVGYWGLRLNAAASQISFVAQSNGVQSTYLTGNIAWVSNDWHLIALAYSPESSKLYLDGVAIANGPGVTLIPDATVRAGGFRIGSDGQNVCSGQYENLKTFNYAVADWEVMDYYAIMYPIIAAWNESQMEGQNNPGQNGPLGDGESGSSGSGQISEWDWGLFAGELQRSANPVTNYPPDSLWLQIADITDQVLYLKVNGTTQSMSYEILSKHSLTDAVWTSEGTIPGAIGTNVTPMTILIQDRTNGLMLWARNLTHDTEGGGLPDWWQLQHFGQVGIDPYADPDNDGWNNLLEFHSGTNPNQFDTPPAPPGFSVFYNNLSRTVTLNWQPAPGSVTGYTITRYDASTGNRTTNSLSPNATSYVDTSPITNFVPEFGEPTYTLQANYTLGSSAGKTLSMFDPNTIISAQVVVGGDGGRNLVVTGPIPVGTTSLRLLRGYTSNYWDYAVAAFEVPIGDLSGNQVFMPDAWFAKLGDSYYAYEYWYVQTVNTNGDVSDETRVDFESWYNERQFPPPFVDGRQQLKQNADFILRAANAWSPFFYSYYDNYIYPSNYSYAGLYEVATHGPGLNSLHKFHPFEENYFFRNFVFATTDLDPMSGRLTTGLSMSGGYTHWPIFLSTPAYLFQATTNTAIPALLDSSSAQWLTFYPQTENTIEGFPAIIGLTGSGGDYAFTDFNGTPNIYGLPFNSVRFAYNDGALETPVLSRGGVISGVQDGGVFWDIVAPELQTRAYYFAHPGSDPLPGEDSFTTDTTTPPVLVAGFGSSTLIAGYAKQALLNGYSNVYSYLGQYFDAAFQIDGNGDVTTNSAGAISPYGEFVATAVGPVALRTMTNWGENVRGTGIVQVVKLVLDVNHDGNMDLSGSGPDNTSWYKPYVLWANNNYDRFTRDADDNDSYDDDVSSTSDAAKSLYTDQFTPDYNYLDGSSNRIISCARDLQDFARLWVAGLTTNLIAALPTNVTVSLSWGDVGAPDYGNPTIDLFKAADADGGVGYLTNSITAAIQVDRVSCPYVGRLGPGDSLQLNGSQFANNWAGNYFIWCGVTNGHGSLYLTIADANGNTLAQTTAYIQIVDIKTLYERWTVGERPAHPPTNIAQIAVENLPPGQTNGFQYPYNAVTDSTTPYILFVHGWNMDTEMKDRFAECAFKRLYWQGYQGRFASFRWPTGYHFTGWKSVITDPDNFDNSEFRAWQSGAGLLNLLTEVNAEYPNRVYLMAHSMGNVVAGEALRQAGSNQCANTYIAMQGAVPSHCYDQLAPVRTLGPLGIADSGTPNRYSNYWTMGASCYFNGSAGAGNYLNFFNTNDFALDKWQIDQNLKPDIAYSYDTSYLPDENRFYRGLILGTRLYFPTNTYEIFAYCVEARCYALGAQQNVGGAFTTASQVELDAAPYSFGPQHLYHSFQFRLDNSQSVAFWRRILIRFGLVEDQ